MATTIDSAEEYLRKSREVEQELGQRLELFSSDYMDEFTDLVMSFQKNIERAKEQDRELRIGILGSVKAGKSSFLNACIFNGESFLPKAATPMTAALTLLSYSDRPSATVHFYSVNDWETIKERAQEYKENLENDYVKYVEQYNKQSKKEDMDSGRLKKEKPLLISKEDFEKRYQSAYNISDYQIAANELVSSAKDLFVDDLLGTQVELEGDVIKQLENYVGAGGQYTPVVSYLELRLDNEYLRGLEIIDTPGLNDPVVSRGIETKRHLGECDAVFLLSPCSQFMDEDTIRLMTNNLPSAGVEELVVIGSKLDSGILNDKKGKFEQKWARALQSYRKQLDQNLNRVKASGGNTSLLSKVDSSEALFVSSMCFNISVKLKKGVPLDDEEAHILELLKNSYDDFDSNPQFLLRLSGIRAVRKRINEIGSRKNEIIESRNDKLLANASAELITVLKCINAEILSSRERLQNCSVEELKRESEDINRVIGKSRLRLTSLFKNAALDGERKGNEIKSLVLKKRTEQGEIIIEDIVTKQTEKVSYGFFGLRKKPIEKTVVHHSADTAKVIDNLVTYATNCMDAINQDFQYLFNEQEFSRQVKEIILGAFADVDTYFDEDEILAPLETLLKDLEIPRIEFDVSIYIDRINSTFYNGCARDEDIHKLSSMQSDCLREIAHDINVKLDERIQKIVETLNSNAGTFADKIEEKLCGELDRISKQVAEKQKYVDSYDKFSEEIKKMKKVLSV